jgi:hypothetical protein
LNKMDCSLRLWAPTSFHLQKGRFVLRVHKKTRRAEPSLPFPFFIPSQRFRSSRRSSFAGICPDEGPTFLKARYFYSKTQYELAIHAPPLSVHGGNAFSPGPVPQHRRTPRLCNESYENVWRARIFRLTMVAALERHDIHAGAHRERVRTRRVFLSGTNTISA